MDQHHKLNHYRQVLKQVIERHAAMMDLGYDHLGRVHEVIIHLRLRADGKVLIEHDGIEYGIARDLLAAGIPAEDILFNMYRTPHPLTETVAARNRSYDLFDSRELADGKTQQVGALRLCAVLGSGLGNAAIAGQSRKLSVILADVQLAVVIHDAELELL